MITETHFAELVQNLPFSGRVHYTLESLVQVVMQVLNDTHGVEVEGVEFSADYPYTLNFRAEVPDAEHVHWEVCGEQEADPGQSLVMMMCSHAGFVTGMVTSLEAFLTRLRLAGVELSVKAVLAELSTIVSDRCSGVVGFAEKRKMTFEVPAEMLCVSDLGVVAAEVPAVEVEQDAEEGERLEAVFHAYEMWRGEPLEEKFRRSVPQGTFTPMSLVGAMGLSDWHQGESLVVVLPVMDDECESFLQFLAGAVVDGFGFFDVWNPANAYDGEGNVAGNIFRVNPCRL